MEKRRNNYRNKIRFTFALAVIVSTEDLYLRQVPEIPISLQRLFTVKSKWILNWVLFRTLEWNDLQIIKGQNRLRLMEQTLWAFTSNFKFLCIIKWISLKITDISTDLKKNWSMDWRSIPTIGESRIERFNSFALSTNKQQCSHITENSV